MNIHVIGGEMAVCRLRDLSQVDFSDEIYFIGKTDEELSLVCGIGCVPENAITKEEGWRAFRIEGMLDFALIGILSKISSILAEEKIGIFVVSTYNTDYVLTKKEDFEQALQALEKNGYRLV